MAVVGLGTDIVSVPRFRAALERHGQRLLDRIFTPAEVAYARSRAAPEQSLAARFAAKEAAFKAVGVGWPKRGVRFVDAEVARAGSGAPGLLLSGCLAELARSRGARRFQVSLSHTEEMALAVVLLESES